MEKDNVKEKKVVRTYRNGKSVHQLDLTITLKPDIGGKKYVVIERRSLFKDEKPLFVGTKEKAEAFFTNVSNQTYVNGILQVIK